MKTAAQVTYEAFKTKKAEPFKGWDKEPDAVKEQWQAAAAAAIAHADYLEKEVLSRNTAELGNGSDTARGLEQSGSSPESVGNEPAKKQDGFSVGLVATAEPEQIVTSLGKIAYDAYCTKVGWKSSYTGAALPPYDGQKTETLDAWEEAGQAVALAVVNGITVMQVTGPEAEALLKKQQANVSHDDARAECSVSGSAR